MSASNTLPISVQSTTAQPSQELDHHLAAVPAIDALAIHHSLQAGEVVESATVRKQKEIEVEQVELARLRELLSHPANGD